VVGGVSQSILLDSLRMSEKEECKGRGGRKRKKNPEFLS